MKYSLLSLFGRAAPPEEKFLEPITLTDAEKKVEDGENFGIEIKKPILVEENELDQKKFQNLISSFSDDEKTNLKENLEQISKRFMAKIEAIEKIQDFIYSRKKKGDDKVNIDFNSYDNAKLFFDGENEWEGVPYSNIPENKKNGILDEKTGIVNDSLKRWIYMFNKVAEYRTKINNSLSKKYNSVASNLITYRVNGGKNRSHSLRKREQRMKNSRGKNAFKKHGKKTRKKNSRRIR